MAPTLFPQRQPRVRLFALIVMATLATPAQAASLYWSGDGTAQGGSGTWGTTLTSFGTAAADVAGSVPRTVGWLDNGDGSVAFAYAAPGDTNLDWAIDILDAGNFLAGGKFDTGAPATWNEGDFSYDGVVDILDAADFFATGLYDAGTYNSPPGTAAVAAVPEPCGMVAVAVVSVAALLRRRARRHRFPATARCTSPEGY